MTTERAGHDHVIDPGSGVLSEVVVDGCGNRAGRFGEATGLTVRRGNRCAAVSLDTSDHALEFVGELGAAIHHPRRGLGPCGPATGSEDHRRSGSVHGYDSVAAISVGTQWLDGRRQGCRGRIDGRKRQAGFGDRRRSLLDQCGGNADGDDLDGSFAAIVGHDLMIDDRVFEIVGEVVGELVAHIPVDVVGCGAGNGHRADGGVSAVYPESSSWSGLRRPRDRAALEPTSRR